MLSARSAKSLDNEVNRKLKLLSRYTFRLKFFGGIPNFVKEFKIYLTSISRLFGLSDGFIIQLMVEKRSWTRDLSIKSSTTPRTSFTNNFATTQPILLKFG
jgi:hypothetical protein